MSYLIVEAQTLADAADDVAAIGSTISKANATAAGPTTAVATAAEDEISEAVAAAAVNDGFAQAFAAASTAYGEAEAATRSSLGQSPIGSAATAAYGEAEAATRSSLGQSPIGSAATAAANVGLVMGPSGLPLPPPNFPVSIAQAQGVQIMNNAIFQQIAAGNTFLGGLQTAINGNPVGLIDAIGLPIAADTGLVPLALFIEGESLLETAGVNFGNI